MAKDNKPISAKVHREFAVLLSRIKIKFIEEGKRPPTTCELTEKIAKFIKDKDKEILYETRFEW